jgi:hypothetical protein
MDYDRSNPVTSKEATINYLNALKENEKSAEKLAELQAKAESIELKSLFNCFENYGKTRGLDQRVRSNYNFSEDETARPIHVTRSKYLSQFFK